MENCRIVLKHKSTQVSDQWFLLSMRDECVYVVHDIDITSCFSGARGSTDLSFERMVIGSSPELTWGKDETGFKDDSLVESKVKERKLPSSIQEEHLLRLRELYPIQSPKGRAC